MRNAILGKIDYCYYIYNIFNKHSFFEISNKLLKMSRMKSFQNNYKMNCKNFKPRLV